MEFMSENIFNEIKKTSINKWEDALLQTEDTYNRWWRLIGINVCQFCYFFVCKSTQVHSYFLCPLWKKGICAEEWNTINKAENLTYELFIEESRKLLKRIQELKYEDIKNNTEL